MSIVAQGDLSGNVKMEGGAKTSKGLRLTLLSNSPWTS